MKSLRQKAEAAKVLDARKHDAYTIITVREEFQDAASPDVILERDALLEEAANELKDWNPDLAARIRKVLSQ